MEVAVSQDHTIALWPGLKEQNSISKKKKKGGRRQSQRKKRWQQVQRIGGRVGGSVEGAKLLALKMGLALSQARWQPLEAGKGKETDSPQSFQEGPALPAPSYVDSSPVRLILDF